MNFITLLILLVNTSLSMAQDGDIIGNWLNEEKDAKIEIYKTGSKYFGKLIWGQNLMMADGSLRKDDKNPDITLKTRTLLNTVIVKDLQYKGKEWTGGTIYDPKSGNTYSCTIKLEGNTLQLRGYKGISLLGRTTIWTKAE